MEPQYVYVKGQGWVIHNYPSGITKDSRDVPIRYECRKPEIGEFFDWFHICSDDYTQNGIVNPVRVQEYVQTNRYFDYSTWTTDHESAYIKYNHAEKRAYYVIIKL